MREQQKPKQSKNGKMVHAKREKDIDQINIEQKYQ